MLALYMQSVCKMAAGHLKFDPVEVRETQALELNPLTIH